MSTIPVLRDSDGLQELLDDTDAARDQALLAESTATSARDDALSARDTAVNSISATGGVDYVVTSITERDNLSPSNGEVALVLSGNTGEFYEWNGSAWNQKGPTLRDISLGPTTVSQLSDLRSTPSSSNGEIVQVSSDDGGLFVSRASDPFGFGDDGAVVLQASDGTWWVRQAMFNSNTVNVKWFGAKADWDGSTGSNNLPAFEDAIRAADSAGVRTVYAPSGDYYLDNTLGIRKDVQLVGDGGYRIDAKTTLHFPANTTGVYVVNRNISGGDDTNGSELRRIALNCTSKDTSGHGVHATSPTSMIGLFIKGFAEHGVFQDGTGDGAVNQWYAKRVRTVDNGKSGFFLEGSNANAGTGINIDAVQNGSYGIYDSSFLGNTFVGCQTSANGDGTTGGAYKADDPNAHTIFLGCYAEGNQNEIFLEQRSMLLGGEINANVNLNGRGYYVQGDIRKNVPTVQEGIFEDIFVSGVNTDRAFTYKAKDATTPLAFSFEENSKNYCVEINDKYRWHLQFLTQDNTKSMGRNNPPSRGVYSQALFPGYLEDRARLIGYDFSPPDESGGYGINGVAKGDTIFNNNSQTGEPIGWRCVSGGPTGTWEPFGQAGHRESSGDPTGSVTPNFVGEEVLDTNNDTWYKSTGTGSSDWTAI